MMANPPRMRQQYVTIRLGNVKKITARYRRSADAFWSLCTEIGLNSKARRTRDRSALASGRGWAVV